MLDDLGGDEGGFEGGEARDDNTHAFHRLISMRLGMPPPTWMSVKGAFTVTLGPEVLTVVKGAVTSTTGEGCTSWTARCAI